MKKMKEDLNEVKNEEEKWRGGREGSNERERKRQLRCWKERGILAERNEEMGRRWKKGRRGDIFEERWLVNQTDFLVTLLV